MEDILKDATTTAISDSCEGRFMELMAFRITTVSCSSFLASSSSSLRELIWTASSDLFYLGLYLPWRKVTTLNRKANSNHGQFKPKRMQTTRYSWAASETRSVEMYLGREKKAEDKHRMPHKTRGWHS